MDTGRPKPADAGGLVQAFSRILRLRAAGIAPEDKIRKIKFAEIIKGDSFKVPEKRSPPPSDEDAIRRREALAALLAKLFASISAIKAAYAQLQGAESACDPEAIQSADEAVVTELKYISDMKLCYVKKQILPCRESQMLAEIQEQRNLLKTFEITSKKLRSQAELKDSQIASLRDKLRDARDQNKWMEERLEPSKSLVSLEGLHLSSVNPVHFMTVCRTATKSIRMFVKLMADEMATARWDLEAVARTIVPGVLLGRPSHKIFAFESYVCRKMFSEFHLPSFSDCSGQQKQRRRKFFERFMGLKGTSPMKCLSEHPDSRFGTFCRLKFLALVHPQMEAAFFGNLSHRRVLNSGGFPESVFFSAFAEMAKGVWLLHALAFCFEPPASIFAVRGGSRFSEVFMESACNDCIDVRQPVGFTVVPGFRVGKTVVQCKVYLQAAPDSSRKC